MCGTGSLHTDWRRMTARPGPDGSGYSLLPSHSVLPSGIVDAARYGGAAVGDVRGRVARFRSGRLRQRRVRVDDQRHARYCASWSLAAASWATWEKFSPMMSCWRPWPAGGSRRGGLLLAGDPTGRWPAGQVAAGVELVRLKDPPGYVQPDALKSCLVNCYDHPGVIPPTPAKIYVEDVGITPKAVLASG